MYRNLWHFPVNLGLEFLESTPKTLNPDKRSSHMDISSFTPDKQVKFQYWLDVIRRCRASGLTNQAWCEQHNVSLKSYYYWIAKIRRLALEDLPRKNYGVHSQTVQSPVLLPEASSEFTEVSLPDRHISYSSPAAILHIGTMKVELFEHTSYELMASILKAVQSC